MFDLLLIVIFILFAIPFLFAGTGNKPKKPPKRRKLSYYDDTPMYMASAAVKLKNQPSLLVDFDEKKLAKTLKDLDEGRLSLYKKRN